MINIKVDMNKVTRNTEFDKITKALDSLKSKEILVGIPQDKNQVHETESNNPKHEITNAELLYIHENGSPVNNVPARPVLEPSLKEEKDYIGEMLGNVVNDVVEGKDIKDSLELIGMEAQNIVRKYFTSGNLAENAPSTIKKKGSSQPLIDTGELRKSITYTVKE